MFGCGGWFAGVTVECLCEIMHHRFPQRPRFEHFGFGSEAKHSGFDFVDGGELEFGDDRSTDF